MRLTAKQFKWLLFIGIFILSLFFQTKADAFTINVVDENGLPVPNGFRFLVEEDTTHPVTPQARVANSLGVSIHFSYAPVVISGDSTGSTALVNVPNNKRYMVSVLPWGPNQTMGYTLSGANVAVGQAAVTITVQKQPIQTAQIFILAHEDTMPLNNVPETLEQGLAGFSIILYDQMGKMMVDAFGNPLGTTYDAAGNVLYTGPGALKTCPTGNAAYDAANCLGLNPGEALIKNIPPGKYGIQVVPPLGTTWVQTATIEGTPGVDSWVKSGEPQFLLGAGAGAWHAWYSFVRPFNGLNTIPNAGGITGTIKGRVVNAHQAAPTIDIALHLGNPVPECYIGLNSLNAGMPQLAIYAAACNDDSTFSIPGVPPGTYELVMWDLPLDNIWAMRNVTIPPTGGAVDLGDVAVNRWFGTLEGTVFYDTNLNGFRDCVTPACNNAAMGDEVGLIGQDVSLRIRDGSLYQATVTGPPKGEYVFTEVFPFFKWIMVEVGNVRFMPTGATIQVDKGGPLAQIGTDPGNGLPVREKLNPQPQPENNGLGWRTQVGPNYLGSSLVEAMILYGDQTNVIDFGKANYPPGQNGGIAGSVFYDTTRAPHDPSFAVQEPWEPGIPKVQINLYLSDGEGNIVDLDGDGQVTFPDAGWTPGSALWPGDAIQIVYTDSWDDNPPTGCVDYDGNVDISQVIYGQTIMNCAETIRTWNQVRPAVYDGAFAIASYYPEGIASGNVEVQGLPTGQYILQVIPPTGYQITKEEDQNVLLGDAYKPAPQMLPPVCIGDAHLVPPYLTLFPGEKLPAPFANQMRPLCDRKEIAVTNGQNAVVSFSLFTEVPKAARGVGLVANDLAVPPANQPVIQEKMGIQWTPVSYRDFNGNELARTYSDQFGTYNALVPSTFSVHIPTPSGVSPNMITVCQNHPGPIPDPNNPGEFITDPQFNPNIGTSCTNWDFWPGKITYTDTPLIPVAAMQQAVGATLDCEYPHGTPLIREVRGPGAGGPYVSAPGQIITILSQGFTQVPNPAYDMTNPGTTPQYITRDYGFGTTKGTVSINGVIVPSAYIKWATDGRSISLTVPVGFSSGQLIVTRGDNKVATPLGITLHIAVKVVRVSPPTVSKPTPIQDAIDDPLTKPGDVILIAPGLYKENIIMWKPVKLQGSGVTVTVLDANPFRPDQLIPWKARLDNLVAGGLVDLAPGQLKPGLSASASIRGSEGAGIMVLGPSPENPNQANAFKSTAGSRIDGLTIHQAQSGGGILVNSYAHFLKITNNRIINNSGTFGGGIRVGTATIQNALCNVGAQSLYCSSFNDNLVIANNQILQNANISTPGAGGISLFNGSDNYLITENQICGNFSTNQGGGVAHFGLSHPGEITRNNIIFNEASFGAMGGDGGGIMISGELQINNYTPGSGSVLINRNLIQGNMAGAGSGSGILASLINGLDVANAPADPGSWYTLDIFNNMIVNNVAGYSGTISLQDAVQVNIINNTIANNDCTATSTAAFPQGAIASVPQAAGIVSWVHTANLMGLTGTPGVGTFSNPVLHNNILWNNKSWIFDTTAGALNIAGIPAGAFVLYGNWDLQVNSALDPVDKLNPMFSILSDNTGYDPSNLSIDPLFVAPYSNALQFGVSPGEGGNFISAAFSPLTITGDYHIVQGSPAIDAGDDSYLGNFLVLSSDYDKQPRPMGTRSDIGAEEFAITQVTLTAKKTGTGTGNITLFPAGIGKCGPDCTIYAPNTTVFITATAGVGSNFDSWSGDVTGKNTTVKLTMNTSKTVIANFVGPSISVVTPIGGDTWKRGERKTIKWTYTGNPGTKVRLELLKGGQFVSNITFAPVSIGTKGSGSYNWLIPRTLGPNDAYQIRVTSVSANPVSGVSANFSVQ